MVDTPEALFDMLDALVDILETFVAIPEALVAISEAFADMSEALSPIRVDVVVAKLGSSPKAAANSLRVSKASGAVSTKLATCVFT